MSPRVPIPASASAIAAGQPRPPRPIVSTRARAYRDVFLVDKKAPLQSVGERGLPACVTLSFAPLSLRVGISTYVPKDWLLWLRGACPSATLDKEYVVLSGATPIGGVVSTFARVPWRSNANADAWERAVRGSRQPRPPG